MNIRVSTRPFQCKYCNGELSVRWEWDIQMQDKGYVEIFCSWCQGPAQMHAKMLDERGKCYDEK